MHVDKINFLWSISINRFEHIRYPFFGAWSVVFVTWWKRKEPKFKYVSKIFQMPNSLLLCKVNAHSSILICKNVNYLIRIFYDNEMRANKLVASSVMAEELKRWVVISSLLFTYSPYLHMANNLFVYLINTC